MCALDDPVTGDELKKTFAELIAGGSSRASISEALSISEETVTNWRKREDIKLMVLAIQQDRASRVLSKTDTKIMKVLESNKDIPVETLLKIRQTFAGEKVTITTDAAKQEAVERLIADLHDDPEAAAKFAAAAASGEQPDSD